jgi:histidine triad (HIT) family protein
VSNRGDKMEGDTIFGKIIRKEIPAAIVYEDEEVLAFRDIAPVAPVHILLIPKRPIVNVAAATEEDGVLLGRLMLTAARIAKAEGLEETGYRIVTNNGAHAGQTVFHLHLHILGGRALGWPPG